MLLNLQSLVCLAATWMIFAQPPASASSPFSDLEIIDLTHTLDGDFPFIPVPGVIFPFALAPIATIDAYGVAANRWIIHEHIGTQIDAPNHFTKSGASLDMLEATDLIVPLVVIDFREHAARDVDASLEVADIRAWEAKHGRIPERAAVVLYTGWDARIKDPAAYINADERHVKHFPGIGVEAASWLIQNRNIWGVGVDTLSFDPGKDVNDGGCPLLRIYPRASCQGEYDLIDVAGDDLYLGAPPRMAISALRSAGRSGCLQPV